MNTEEKMFEIGDLVEFEGRKGVVTKVRDSWERMFPVEVLFFDTNEEDYFCWDGRKMRHIHNRRLTKDE